MSVLRVGTRASALALWQTNRVCETLSRRQRSTEIIEINTTGDLHAEAPIGQLADPALFTRQLDEAMLASRIDLAVHSLKDLPTRLPEGIVIAAVSAREDARDALVTRGGGFAGIPDGGTIATSSLRRRAQLLRARPDLVITEIRGNVGTRLAKLEQHAEWSATVLAAAGLIRLGLEARIAERLSFDLMLPAPGQAALAVTARADDASAIDAVRRALHDERSALCVQVERGLLHDLEGGCEVPVAALAEFEDAKGWTMRCRARVASLDGRQVAEADMVRPVSTPDEAEAFGRDLAAELRSGGAGRILDELGLAAGRGRP
jgi:hydroxymethylbilane synthase